MENENTTDFESLYEVASLPDTSQPILFDYRAADWAMKVGITSPNGTGDNGETWEDCPYEAEGSPYFTKEEMELQQLREKKIARFKLIAKVAKGLLESSSSGFDYGFYIQGTPFDGLWSNEAIDQRLAELITEFQTETRLYRLWC